jgi:hypothetical protein
MISDNARNANKGIDKKAYEIPTAIKTTLTHINSPEN